MAIESKKKTPFTKYQVFIIAIIAILQFTIVLDFMVLSPLGAILLDDLNITTAQFGLVVSAYAFSAGASGLLAAGFADKFDRKKLLLFFYTGFLLGTLFCAVAPSYHILMIARIITGMFGGVISSISFAIITDLFVMEVRGRVMGFVQMAFSASQILGIPIGLVLANKFGWHAPFWMITGFGFLVGLLILFYLQPVDKHLSYQSGKHPLMHLWKTVSEKDYLVGFLATTLLATGGFMLMPFGSAFSIHNLNLTMEDLPYLYGVTGIFTIIFGPILGRVSDKIGKYRLFIIGTIISIIMVIIYTSLGPTPLALVITINVILFVGITSRMIAASALMTGIPKPQDRGAFMSINSSVQQLSGGISSAVAGIIVIQSTDGKLHRYDTLGLVVVAAMIVAAIMMYFLNSQVKKNLVKSHEIPTVEQVI